MLGIVMAHQAPPLKSALVLRLLSALVLPDPEHYRAHLRRLAALEGMDVASRGRINRIHGLGFYAYYQC